MRILHIYKDYFPVLGGMENHIKWLAEAMAQRGHEVRVLVTNTRNQTVEEKLNGVHVIKTARQYHAQSTPLSAQMPARVWRESRGMDIVHLHAPHPPGELYNLLFGRARRTVISWQSDIIKQKTLLRLYGPLLRIIVRKADAIFPSTLKYAQSSPWLQQALHKCTPIALGIDLDRFAPRPDAARALRAAWGLSDKIVTISVGRLRYYKGYGDLIAALPAAPDVHAVIVGTGPMEAEWRALANALGVAERVHWVGEPDDAALPTYYQAADVFVLPANSRAEAYGIALVEALASRLPAITTEIGTGTSWINQHQLTGLVVPPSDPAALAVALNALAEDPAKRSAFADAAHARAYAEFGLARMVDRVEAAYREVLGRL